MSGVDSAAVPLVGVIMGSRSDWETMSEAAAILTQFGVAHECRVVSAHRTPAWLTEYSLSAAGRGLRVIPYTHLTLPTTLRVDVHEGAALCNIHSVDTTYDVTTSVPYYTLKLQLLIRLLIE